MMNTTFIWEVDMRIHIDIYIYICIGIHMHGNMNGCSCDKANSKPTVWG